VDEVTLRGLDRFVLLGDVGHREHLGLSHLLSLPLETEQANHALGDTEYNQDSHLMGQNLSSVLTTGGDQRGVVGVLDGVVLRYRFEEDKDHHHFADDADEQPGAPKSRS